MKSLLINHADKIGMAIFVAATIYIVGSFFGSEWVFNHIEEIFLSTSVIILSIILWLFICIAIINYRLRKSAPVSHLNIWRVK